MALIFKACFVKERESAGVRAKKIARKGKKIAGIKISNPPLRLSEQGFVETAKKIAGNPGRIANNC
jgi:hypothetical protein